MHMEIRSNLPVPEWFYHFSLNELILSLRAELRTQTSSVLSFIRWTAFTSGKKKQISDQKSTENSS